MANARFVLILAASVSIADRSAMPSLVPVIADDLGTRIDAVGLSLTVYAAGYALFQLVWSALSNRWGRVRVVAVTTALAGIANLGSALAWDAPSYVAFRGLAGAAFAATITVVLIYFGDTLTMTKRAVATANLAAAVAIGMTVGTLGAGLVAQLAGWRWVYAAIAAACAVLTVALMRLPEPTTMSSERMLPSLGRLVRNGWAMLILFFAVLEGALLIGVFNFLPVALQAEGTVVLVASFATAAFGMTVLVVSQLMKLILGRWPSWLLLAIAGTAMTAGFAVVAARLSPVSVLIGAALMGLAWALGHTTLQTWMTDAVTGERAIGMSFFSMALFVGAGIGAACGNLAASGPAGSFGLLFLGSAATAIVVAAATSEGRARYHVREDPPPPPALREI